MINNFNNISINNKNVRELSLNGKVVWRSIPADMLKFTAIKPSTIKLENVYGTYKTSTNKRGWLDYTIGDTINLNEGDTLYFSAISSNLSCCNNKITKYFSMTGEISASGNIQYMLDSTGEQLSVPEYAYYFLFTNCSSLIHAPDLPAIELAKGCYYTMFAQCNQLTSAPILPATQIVEICYKQMFMRCTSLNSISVNFTDWNIAIKEYNNPTFTWLYRVSLTGDFYCPAELSDIRGNSYIPEGWNVFYN